MLAKISKHKLFLLFSFLYFVFCLLTYRDYGITSDEEVNYRAGKVYFHYLFSDLDERTTIEKTVSPKDSPTNYPAFRLYPGIVSLLNRPNSYEFAHLLNMFFGYFGFLVAYLIVYEITGSNLAIITPLLLFFNPYYFGHIPANPKDIPFSTLYALSLYQILKFPSDKLSRHIILGICMGILVGMRVIGATLFVILIIKTIMYRNIFSQAFRNVLSLILVLFVAAVTIYVCWPFLWDHTMDKILMLIKNSGSFTFWDRKILFDGILISKDEHPWHYLFTYLLYKTPIIVIIGFFGAVFMSINRTSLFFLVIVLNLILYLVIQPTIYNEMRHFIFLVPVITIVASVFFVGIISNGKSVLAVSLVCTLSLGIVKSLYDFILLHPYQYVYFNELAGDMHYITDKYEVDYWSASYREASEYLKELSAEYQETIRVYPCNLDFGVVYYSQNSFLVVKRREESDYIICDNLNALKKNLVLDNKIIYRVIRKGATLSYVAKTM